MSPAKLAIICMLAAAGPLIAIAASLGSDAAGLSTSANVSTGTVGASRNGYLAEISQVYVSQKGGGISHGMKSGYELAPLPFLNDELKRRGAKWRVRSTDGLDAQTYDVS